MQQNLKTLDDLQAKMDHLVGHSDELMKEMDDLKVRKDKRKSIGRFFELARGMVEYVYTKFI